MGKFIKRVFVLKEEIGIFMENKGKPVHQFEDPNWMADFGYLTDILIHLNGLNMQLQGKNNMLHNLFDHVKAFENKLCFGKFSFYEETFHISQHCPNVKFTTTRNTVRHSKF